MRHLREQQVDPLPNAPTERQEAFLRRNNIHPDHPLDFYEASHAINRFVHTRRQLSPTVRQEKLLKKHGQWRQGMTRGEAFDRMKQILAQHPAPR